MTKPSVIVGSVLVLACASHAHAQDNWSERARAAVLEGAWGPLEQRVERVLEVVEQLGERPEDLARITRTPPGELVGDDLDGVRVTDGDLEVPGDVRASVIVASSEVVIRGDLVGTVVICGGPVAIHGDVRDALIVARETLHVGGAARGAVLLAREGLRVEGEARGSVLQGEGGVHVASARGCKFVHMADGPRGRGNHSLPGLDLLLGTGSVPDLDAAEATDEAEGAEGRSHDDPYWDLEGEELWAVTDARAGEVLAAAEALGEAPSQQRAAELGDEVQWPDYEGFRQRRERTGDLRLAGDVWQSVVVSHGDVEITGQVRSAVLIVQGDLTVRQQVRDSLILCSGRIHVVEQVRSSVVVTPETLQVDDQIRSSIVQAGAGVETTTSRDSVYVRTPASEETAEQHADDAASLWDQE